MLFCYAADLRRIAEQSMSAVFRDSLLSRAAAQGERVRVNVSKLQVIHLPATYGRPLLWRIWGRVMLLVAKTSITFIFTRRREEGYPYRPILLHRLTRSRCIGQCRAAFCFVGVGSVAKLGRARAHRHAPVSNSASSLD